MFSLINIAVTLVEEHLPDIQHCMYYDLKESVFLSYDDKRKIESGLPSYEFMKESVNHVYYSVETYI